MATSLKISLASQFLASTALNPLFLPVEGYDDALNGGTISLIDFANTSLFAGQASSFAGILNGVKNKGSVIFGAGGGTAPTYTGGGMVLPAGAAGAAGLKIGATATAGVPHVNDFSQWGTTDQYLISHCFKLGAALTNVQIILGMQSEVGATTGTGKLQWGLTGNLAGGLIIYFAGQQANTGFTPAVGKIYVISFLPQPNPTTGLTTIIYWIYNVTDNVIVVDGGAVTLPYAALVPMVGGGQMLAFGYSITGFGVPTATFYRQTVEHITGALGSGRDPAEQFAAEARKMRAELIANVIG